MIHKMIVTATIAGLLSVYAAMLYAFVHHDPRNLQPTTPPAFDAHGEPLNLKARDFHD